MCHTVCFEAGRFTQTQASRTASRCSRKWMSGHADADALTQFVRDRNRQIVQQFVRLTSALQDALLSAGRRGFSLDKPLSWMSPGFPRFSSRFSCPPVFPPSVLSAGAALP